MSSGWQVIIRDPAFLSGTSLRQIASVIASCARSKFVAVRDVEGSGKSIPELAADVGILGLDELLELAVGITQIDWGDFFFCDTSQKAGTISHDDDYVAAIPKADVTLRCVDDTFYYVYGTSSRLLAELINVLPSGDTKHGELADLDYPD